MSRVILWSAHRCGSTVFERSVRELDSVKVLHEPHQKAFYYGPDKVCPSTHYYDDGTARVLPDASFEATRKMIISLGEECVKNVNQHLFIKDIAFYITGKHQEYFRGEFAEFTHTFLIRHPISVGLSLYKALMKCPADKRFSPEALGFDSAYVSATSIESTPIVIDADDLLNSPRLAKLGKRYKGVM